MTTTVVKRDNKLIHVDETSQNVYNRFRSMLPEDTEVRVDFKVIQDDFTLSQIRYVHVLIREVSKLNGDSFQYVKDRFKEQVGLKVHYRVHDEVRQHMISLAELDREDLSYVIAQFEQFAMAEGLNLAQPIHS